MESSPEAALEIINKSGFISVKDLTSALGVTRITTSRYLQTLEEKKLIKRVQGGALSLHKEFEFCPPYYYSDNDPFFGERVRIAQKAVEMIGKKDCVFLGGGRNTLHMAREIRSQRKDVTIVTNSLHAALLVAPVSPAVVVGDSLMNEEGILTGPVNESIMVNKAFIAPGSVTPEGFFNGTPAIIELERVFVKKTRLTVVLVDSEMRAMFRPYKELSFDEADVMITSDKAAVPPESGKIKIIHV
jgi:DeoR/GlpR family transcriptional regulator of sugar metabolism